MSKAGRISRPFRTRSAAGGGKRNAGLAVMFAFDILYLNGQDLRRRPLTKRRGLLAPVIQGAAPGIMLSEGRQG